MSHKETGFVILGVMYFGLVIVFANLIEWIVLGV